MADTRNNTKGLVVMSNWFDEKEFSEPPMSFKLYMKRLGLNSNQNKIYNENTY